MFSDTANRRLVADVYSVVTGRRVDGRACMDGPDSQVIVAAAGIDLDELDPAVRDLHLRDHGCRDRTGQRPAAARGRKGQTIRLIGARDHEPVVVVAGTVDHIHLGQAVERYRHQVMLGIESVICGVVQGGHAAPVDDRQRRVADADLSVEVIDNQGVVARPAIDLGFLEDMLQVFDDGTGSETVTGVGELVCRILAHLKRPGALTVQKRADDQFIVV